MRSGMIILAFVGLLGTTRSAPGQGCASLGANPYYRAPQYDAPAAAIPPALHPTFGRPIGVSPVFGSPVPMNPYITSGYGVPRYTNSPYAARPLGTGYYGQPPFHGQPAYRAAPAYPVMNRAIAGKWPSTNPYQSFRPPTPFHTPNSSYVGPGIIGQPKAYVPGQPLRNLLRYITP
jgi:hypothetical protein